MTHYGTRSKNMPRRVEAGWVNLNTQVGDVVNAWARRNDIVTYIGPDGGQGIAPAFFDPTSYEVEVNTDIAFGKHVTPELVGDFTQRPVQFEWVVASGLIMHEAMHARYTTVPVPRVDAEIRKRDLPQDLMNYANEAYTLMEELRIEYNGMQQYPKNRAFLRGSALMLVTPDPDAVAKMNPLTLGLRILLLGIGRVDALVLEKADVLTLRLHTDSIIAAADRKILRKIWREFIELNDRRPDEFDKMIDLAVAWAVEEKRLRDKHEEENPKPEKGEEGEGGAASQELMDALMDALGKAGDLAEMKAETEGAQQRAREREEQAEAEREEERKDEQQNETVASKVFGENRSTGRAGMRSRSGVTSKRQPTAEERTTAFSVAKALKRAKYRDRLITQKRVEVPPGRLRVGAVMQQDVARLQGRNIRVEAFKQTRRQHIEDPNLTVGMMCDISGSMGAAMEPMAVSTWVMSEAVRKVKGKIAATYFGNSVFSVLAPGEHFDEVNVYGATDMHEAFDEGFRALDGALKLLSGEGARLLIIASDGQFKYGEEDRAAHWLKRCKKAGVAVIWLAFKDANAALNICNETGASYVKVGRDVTAAADIIGRACQDALTNARTN